MNKIQIPKFHEAFKRVSGTAPAMVKLDYSQNEVWEQARAAMLSQAPHLAHLFYTLMNPRSSGHVAYFTPEIPIAATDGVNLFLNPATALDRKRYSVGNRVFMCGHEIFHNVFNHMGVMAMLRRLGYVIYPDGMKLPYHHSVANAAMDYGINALMIASKIGVYHKEWLYDPNMSVEGMESWVDIYRKLFESGKVKIIKLPPGPCNGGAGGEGDEEEENDQGKGNNPGGKGEGKGKGKSDEEGEDEEGAIVDTGNQKGFDEHLEPGTGAGKDPQEAEAERNEQEWQTAVAAGMAAAEAQGLLPENLKRIFSLVLEPKVDWKDRIRALVMRAVGSDEYSWRALDRRLIVRGIGAPGRLGYTCGVIVIGVDTSGSIWASPKTLEMFFAEMSGILEDLNPEIVHVVWCDAAVHRVDEVTDAQDINLLRAEPVPGGGGTSFVPVFDWVREQRIEPDALIYLTDLMGSFPAHQPEYPTIWGTINTLSPPWGETVMIPKQSER